ncbi:MAG: hypothetical protein DDT18_00050 [Actinobacteria bacterium]|nr:hypothetical protein [Actinomycetota bacterium]
MLAANSSGPEGRVFAFEPVPGNFEVLKRNIQVNRYTDIIYPIPKAVGVRPGMISIFLYKNSDSHGMFGHPHVAAQEVISVECVTIDEFLAERPVDVIKMDIEGNEPYALKGMAETISKNNNLILFTELAPLFLRRAGVEPKDYVLQLEQLGFDVRLIDEHSRCLKPITEDLLAEDDPSWHANLYCIKRKNG